MLMSFDTDIIVDDGGEGDDNDENDDDDVSLFLLVTEGLLFSSLEQEVIL